MKATGLRRFEAELVFLDMNDAKAAERKLRAAGFTTEITDEVDIYSQAAFMNIMHPSDHDWDMGDELDRLVAPIHCFCPEGGVVDV